jgi:7-cyano-7-deazaguanine synthase
MEIVDSCIVLLSGGIDSAVMLAMAREMGYERIYTLSFDYGQRHRAELSCAISQSVKQKVTDQRIIFIDLGRIGGSSLTDPSMEVPKDRHAEGFNWDIPSTYVPSRNVIFLSFALAWAEVLAADHIFIGANSMDYAGYPDCRPEFFRAFEKMANTSTAGAVEGRRQFKIKAPLITFSKEDVIREGVRLGVDFSRTFSCYDPDPAGLSCGHCDACRLRMEGFQKAGVEDPAPYVENASPTPEKAQKP